MGPKQAHEMRHFYKAAKQSTSTWRRLLLINAATSIPFLEVYCHSSRDFAWLLLDMNATLFQPLASLRFYSRARAELRPIVSAHMSRCEMIFQLLHHSFFAKQSRTQNLVKHSHGPRTSTDLICDR